MTDTQTAAPPAEFDEAYLAAVKAALTAAGITVHHEEGSLPDDYVDLLLTPIDADTPVVLGWRPQEGGWHVVVHDGEPDIRRMGLPLLADPAELVRVLPMYAPDVPPAATAAPYEAGDAAPAASYIQLTDTPVARTVDHGGRVLVDVDHTGSPVGVEIIGPPAPADQPALDLDAIRYRTEVIAGPWAVGAPRCTDNVDAWEIPILLPDDHGTPDTADELCVLRYQTGGYQYPHAVAQDRAEFIAAARTDVPALLAEVDRLRAGAQADITEAVAVATADLGEQIDRLRAQLTPAAPLTDRELLVAVHRWARGAGWTCHPDRGWINTQYERDATLAVGWDDTGLLISRRGRDAHQPWPTYGEIYPAASVRQAVDILYAIGILPAHLCSAAGALATVRQVAADAADEIDAADDEATRLRAELDGNR